MGLPKIGAVLALDGEREYKSAITSINSTQRSMRAEMKLVTEEFYGQQNSLEALTKKQEILEKQHTSQAMKIEVCKNALEKYSAAQEKAGEKVESAANELKSAEKQLEKLKHTSGVTTEEIQKQEEAVKKAREELENANNIYQHTVKKEEEWKTSLTNANAELLKIDRTLEENKGYLEEAKNSTDKNAISINEYGKKLKETGNDAEEFRKKTVDAVTALSAIMSSGRILEGVKNVGRELLDCVDASAEFEKSMAKVGTIAEKNEVPLGKMSKDILELSNNLGVAVTDIAEATYNAISSGRKTEEAVAFAGQSTKLAMGGFTDAKTSVDILTTTLNAYGLEVQETERVSDVLITTQNLGKTTVAELATTMGRVIPLAAAYHVELENLSSAYAIMTANGIDTAYTTTYIKSMLNELGDSNSKVAKILTEQTGKSFLELNKEGKSLGDVMEILGKSVDGDAVKFSNLWSRSEAGIGALSLLNSGSAKYQNTLVAMQKSAGATEEAFGEMADTTEMAGQKLENSSRNLKIAIGDVLKPSMEDAYEAGTDLLTWAAEFVEEHPEVVQALTALTIGVGTFAGALTVATAAMKAYQMIKTLVDPTTALVTAIAGLSMAATSFVVIAGLEKTELQKINDETHELVKSSKELSEEHKKAAESRKLSKKELETEAIACKNLSAELLELQNKTSLSNEEQIKQENIVTQLNQAIPTLNLAIDEQSGKLNMSKEALLENVEAMNQLAIASAAQEDLAEIASEQWENEKKLAQLREQEAEQLMILQEAEREYNEALERQKETGEEIWKQMENYGYAKEAYVQLTDEIKNTEEAQMALGEEWSKTQEFIGDTTSTYAAKDAVTDLGIAYDESGNMIGSAAEKTKVAFVTMGNSIRESVQSQIDIFSEFEQNHKISSEEVIKNMESQVEGFKSWGDNLSELAGRSDENGALINEGLLKHLVDLGPEGAGYVEAFVNMTDEELQKANELWEESISLPDDIADKFEESGQNLMKGLKTGIESGADDVKKSMKKTSIDAQESFNAAAGIKSPSKEMEKSGKYLIEGLILGVKKDTSKAKSSMKDLSETVVKEAATGMSSEKAEIIGLQFSRGIASGIRAGKSEVINAAVDVARAAVKSANSTLQINSPSKVTMETGKSFVEGLVEGVKAKTDVLKDAVKGALDEGMINEAERDVRRGGIKIAEPVTESSGPVHVEVYIQPQQMSNEELDRTFDYINERFGTDV